MSFFSDNMRALSQARWEPLGEGTYNQVKVTLNNITLTFNGRSYTGRWVYKEPKRHQCTTKTGKIFYEIDELSMPERAVHIWNEFYPNNPAVKAGLGMGSGNGWMAPFLGKQPPNDEQTAEGILRIYREHRRIVTDGCGAGNFVLQQGRAECVDVDYALGRHSPLSQKTFEEDIYDEDDPEQFGEHHHDYWASYYESMPLCVRTIVTLLYLEKSMAPGDIDNRHLTLEMIEKLREPRYQGTPASVDLLELLNPKPIMITDALSTKRAIKVEETKQKRALEEDKRPPRKKARALEEHNLPSVRPPRITKNESALIAKDLSIIKRAQSAGRLTRLERQRLRTLQEEGCLNRRYQFNPRNTIAQKLMAFNADTHTTSQDIALSRDSTTSNRHAFFSSSEKKLQSLEQSRRLVEDYARFVPIETGY